MLCSEEERIATRDHYILELGGGCDMVEAFGPPSSVLLEATSLLQLYCIRAYAVGSGAERAVCRANRGS